jgi:hypothetical protein
MLTNLLHVVQLNPNSLGSGNLRNLGLLLLLLLLLLLHTLDDVTHLLLLLLL